MFLQICMGLKHFFEHLFQVAYNWMFAILGLIAYLIGYPRPILIFVLVFFVIDILTKIYSICINNGGLIKSFMSGKLSSKGFWIGFLTKLIGYFVVLTTANFAIITPEISYIGNGIASVLYLLLFCYEIISNFENLRDAKFGMSSDIVNKINEEKDKILGKSIDDIK